VVVRFVDIGAIVDHYSLNQGLQRKHLESLFNTAYGVVKAGYHFQIMN
jgi:hypothetical protein